MRTPFFAGLACLLLAAGTVAACGDGDEPPALGPSALDAPVPRDSGAGGAEAGTLPPLGALTLESAPTIEAFAGRDVTLHATVRGGAGPYRIAWAVAGEPALGLGAALTHADGLNPTLRAPSVAAPTDVRLEASAVDATGARTTADVTVKVLPSELAVTSGGDQVVMAGEEARLHALVTGDLEGLSFAWTQKTGTPTVTIEGATTANPAVAIPGSIAAETVLVFEVTVVNGAGSRSVADVSLTARPSGSGAGAGADVSVASGDTVRLTATGGSTWTWTQTGGPSVVLTGADGSNPSFTAPRVTVDTALTFQLAASGGATDSVDVTVKAPAPLVVTAGDDVDVSAGADVALGGRASGGAGPYTFAWTQTSGTAVALGDPAASNPKLGVAAVSADEEDAFELVVTDANGATAKDSVVLRVKAPSAGAADAGQEHRPLTDNERTVASCTGDACNKPDEVVCDERAPFALTTLDFDGAGAVSIQKRCVDEDTCLSEWWRSTSELDQCVSLLPPTSAPLEGIQSGGVKSTCSFCCLGRDCNAGVVPALGTTANCDDGDCYPER
jgi:hypothetical protein